MKVVKLSKNLAYFVNSGCISLENNQLATADGSTIWVFSNLSTSTTIIYNKIIKTVHMDRGTCHNFVFTSEICRYCEEVDWYQWRFVRAWIFPTGVHLQNLQVGVEILPVDVSSRPQTLYGVTRSVLPLCQLEASKCDGIYWQSNGINIMISISSAINFDKFVQVNSIYQPWCFYKDISHWLAFMRNLIFCVLTWLWLQMNDWKICCQDEVRQRQRHLSWVDGRWGHLKENH